MPKAFQRKVSKSTHSYKKHEKCHFQRKVTKAIELSLQKAIFFVSCLKQKPMKNESRLCVFKLDSVHAPLLWRFKSYPSPN